MIRDKIMKNFIVDTETQYFDKQKIKDLFWKLSFCYADLIFPCTIEEREQCEQNAYELEMQILQKFGLPYKEKYLKLFMWDTEGYVNTGDIMIENLHLEAENFLLSTPTDEDNKYK